MRLYEPGYNLKTSYFNFVIETKFQYFEILNWVRISLQVWIPQQVFDNEITIETQEAESVQNQLFKPTDSQIDQSVGKIMPTTKCTIGHGVRKQNKQQQ